MTGGIVVHVCPTMAQIFLTRTSPNGFIGFVAFIQQLWVTKTVADRKSYTLHPLLRAQEITDVQFLP